MARVSPARHCDACNGRGWVLVPVPGTSGRARRCGCAGEVAPAPSEMESRLRAAGMTAKRDLQSAIEKWDAERHPEPTMVLNWARCLAKEGPLLAPVVDIDTRLERARNRPDERGPITGIVVHGKPGRGKSKAAAIALRLYIENGGRRAVWVDAKEAVEAVMTERGAHSEDLRKKILEARFLVIDDYGAQRADHDGEVQYWITYRHREAAPTIITLNDNAVVTGEPKDLLMGLDSRVVSRLAEWEFFEATGPDYRRREW